MVIQIDTREKPHAIEKILETFDKQNIKHISSKMYVGDYQDLSNGTLVIDRKQNLQELMNNVCRDHIRFRNELIRAQEAGIKIIVLIEHGDGIKTLEDVKNWKNPYTKKYGKGAMAKISGDRLYKTLCTMSKKYGVVFEFCDKSETGKRIIEILSKKAI